MADATDNKKHQRDPQDTGGDTVDRTKRVRVASSASATALPAASSPLDPPAQQRSQAAPSKVEAAAGAMGPPAAIVASGPAVQQHAQTASSKAEAVASAEPETKGATDPRGNPRWGKRGPAADQGQRLQIAAASAASIEAEAALTRSISALTSSMTQKLGGFGKSYRVSALHGRLLCFACLTMPAPQRVPQPGAGRSTIQSPDEVSGAAENRIHTLFFAGKLTMEEYTLLGPLMWTEQFNARALSRLEDDDAFLALARMILANRNK